jgi:molybdopterin synthase sulfur carrier subunit
VDGADRYPSPMPRVSFTANLQRHVHAPSCNVAGRTVREALEAVFQAHPLLRGYVVDEHGALRKHMIIFVAGQQIEDRETLSDAVPESAEIYVMQALSGG